MRHETDELTLIVFHRHVPDVFPCHQTRRQVDDILRPDREQVGGHELTDLLETVPPGIRFCHRGEIPTMRRCMALLPGSHRQAQRAKAVVGGAGRGVSPRPLVEEVARWDPSLLGAIALPDDGEELAAACGVRVLAVAADVGDAVRRAAELVAQGGLVLFSPGAPTPAAQGDWKARSNAFRSAVAGLPPGGVPPSVG